MASCTRNGHTNRSPWAVGVEGRSGEGSEIERRGGHSSIENQGHDLSY